MLSYFCVLFRLMIISMLSYFCVVFRFMIGSMLSYFPRPFRISSMLSYFSVLFRSVQCAAGGAEAASDGGRQTEDTARLQDQGAVTARRGHVLRGGGPHQRGRGAGDGLPDTEGTQHVSAKTTVWI